MSNPLKFHVEEWALIMLAQATGITALNFKHQENDDDAEDSCIMSNCELGKRSEEGDRHYDGKLTISLRVRQDIADATWLDYWNSIDTALRTCTSALGATYAAANLPRGLILHDEDAEDDKDDHSDNFRHMSRTIPISVCP